MKDNKTFQYLLIGAALLVLPLVLQLFGNAWVRIADVALLYVLLALGLNIVVGYAGLLDLGYVAFFAVGAYMYALLSSPHLLDTFPALAVYFPNGMHMPLWVIVPLGAALAGLFGMLLGAPTLKLRGDYLAIVTLGFGEIIPEVFRNGDDIAGVNITNGNLGIAPVDKIMFGSVELGPFDTDLKFVIYAALTALVLTLSLRLRDGRLGRAWLAIREDELAASMMGVPLMRTKLAAYAVGATAGGIGGVAFSTHIGAVLPDRFQFAISIILLAMVVLGGMGNVWGVLVGALFLAWFNSTGLKQIGVTINQIAGTDFDFTTLTFLLFGMALILMMLFRREGFFPEARTKAIMQEPERSELEAHGAQAEYAEAEEHVHAPSEEG